MPSPTVPIVTALKVLATFTPPSPSRAWFTAPHPTLPILATCHADKTVRIYSLTSYTLLSTISGGHKRSIRCCAWKPNLKGESVLATGSFDASVGIWRHWDTENPYANRPDHVNEFAGTTADDDDEEWRFAIVLDGHESEVKSVAWSTGGNLLATCSRDKSVWIWEEVGEDDYETVAVLQEHEGDVKCVAWHPEEELLVSASYDDDVRLWREEIDDWGCVGVIKGHESTVWCVAWEMVVPQIRPAEETEDKNEKERQQMRESWFERRQAAGPRLATCSEDRTVKIWRRVPREKVQQSRLSIIKSGSNEEEWVEESILPTVHTCGIYAISWHKSGRLVSTGGDGTIVVYDERWKPSIESASSSTYWRIIAQADAAHGVFEINHVAWAAKPTPRKDDKDVSNDGNNDLIVTTGDDGSVRVWEIPVT